MAFFKRRKNKLKSPVEQTDRAEEPIAESVNGSRPDSSSAPDAPADEPTTEPAVPAEAPSENGLSPEPQAPASPPKKSGGFFGRLKSGLSKTREVMTTDIDKLFVRKLKVDDELLDELEELLVTSDIGVQTAVELIEKISKQSSKIENADQLRELLKTEIREYLNPPAADKPLQAAAETPHVVMVVGVNGVGKTTTVGKLASRAASQGKKVLIAAADTFRAAAVEQLAIWAQRSGADIVRHKDGADPAAVAYDAIEAARARGCDLVLVDTAGRLHTKVNLMEELKKIKRSIAKNIPSAPHETILVLDATTGQNAISQANLFNEALHLTGIALTKLDGTAKGGIAVAICKSLEIPLKYVGVGEQIEDLQDFDPRRFVDAMF